MAKTKTRKGLRPGRNTEDILELTASEKEWISDRRELGGYDPGSVGYKILLVNDPLRVKIRQLKLAIAIRLNHIMNTKATVERWKKELVTGELVTTTENGMLMSAEELATAIHHADTNAESEVFAIKKDLAEILGMVTYKDPALNVVMSIEQYEKFVGTVEAQITKLGYDLFALEV